ncbi:hypothetical protein ACC739_38225, partial [Rhizobium ruizarguesonis]
LFVDTLRLASDEQDRSGRVLADCQVIGSTRHLITASCGVQEEGEGGQRERSRQNEAQLEPDSRLRGVVSLSMLPGSH